MSELEKKFISAEGINQMRNDLEKKFISGAGLLEVMKIVASRLDKLEDVQERLVGELEMMTNKVEDN